MAQLPPVKEKALEIFSGLSSSYDRVLDLGTLTQDRRWKRWLVQKAGLESGSKVLDVGCGTCVLEEGLRGDCFLVGVDLTKEMLGIARAKRLPAVGSLLLSDGEVLPFRDGSFDVVVSCYVVKYCNPGSLASETARVLRRGGRLALYDFARPRGPLFPFNAMYTYGGLPIIGKLLDLTGSSSALTFRELPGIISKRAWDEGFEDVLSSSGFTQVERTVLSGGTAVGFSAFREG